MRIPVVLLLLLLADCGRGEMCEQMGPGVMLSFDDYSESWVENLDLFAAHEARVTFYVSGEFLLDVDETRLALQPLAAAGHAIGVHTVHHRRATEEVSADADRWLRDEVLAARDVMEESLGVEMNSFAYPYGDHNARTNTLLFDHFSFVRGFRRLPSRNSVAQFDNLPRFLNSTSIDNEYERSGAYFLRRLDRTVGSHCTVWAATSHEIGEHRWGIERERLDWLLGEIGARGLRYYLPEDFL